MAGSFEVNLHSSISEISEVNWNSCAYGGSDTPDDPFTQFSFLHALEVSGSVGGETGWIPRPLSVSHEGQIIAVAPLYLKLHSQGEYIFDHSWAEALYRAGREYYPKLQCAVPFSPVTGRRLLTRAGYERDGTAALLSGMVQVAQANGLSSAHITFCTEAEQTLAQGAGFLPRLTQQFHWVNEGYESYEAFLASLTSRKRKALPITLVRPRPLDEAISSAGGVKFEAMDRHLMLTRLPGVFCAGEMLDWEAPTGGYLLTACFASGLRAGKAAAEWLNAR